MFNAKNNLQCQIKHETLLPEINSQACVHSFFDQANCQACVDACSKQAWLLDGDGLELDTSVCDGCGLCVPSCPGGAIHINFPWIVRPFNGRIFALFACAQSSINNEDTEQIPCIHALGMRQLLLIYNSGIKYILISTGICNHCSLLPSENIHQRLEQINSLLSERNKPPLKILEHRDKIWKKIYANDEVNNQGTQLSRRSFLSGGGKVFRQQLVVMDTLNIPESRTIPLGQLLSNDDNRELHWPCVPLMNESRCNGCDICIKLCPTGALQLTLEASDVRKDDVLEKDPLDINLRASKTVQENVLLSYSLNPQDCIGCGICESLCELQAISIHKLQTAKIYHINLLTKYCSGCGNDFHLPKKNPQSQSNLCHICSQQNHSKNLFQRLN